MIPSDLHLYTFHGTCGEHSTEGQGGRKEARRDVGGLGQDCSCEVVKMIGSRIYFEGRADRVS